MDYIAIIHKDPNSDFGVSFPDFPGCITAGRTLDEAKDMAIEALTGHIEVMRDTGESVPDPSTFDEVMKGLRLSGRRGVSGERQGADQNRASEIALTWQNLCENRYEDYLYLHSLSLKMAEAFA